MTKLINFIRTTFIGGVLIILPIALLLTVFRFVFNFITDVIEPITKVINKDAQMYELLAQIVAIIFIVLFCFMVGVLLQTGIGRWMHRVFEERILKAAPGYTMIKETIMQLLGGSKPAFSQVCLVQIFQNEVLVTGFITDDSNPEIVSVFIPTGPNPTSGFIYHMPKRFVFPINVSTDKAMRSVISCGSGSADLIACKGGPLV